MVFGSSGRIWSREIGLIDFSLGPWPDLLDGGPDKNKTESSRYCRSVAVIYPNFNNLSASEYLSIEGILNICSIPKGWSRFQVTMRNVKIINEICDCIFIADIYSLADV